MEDCKGICRLHRGYIIFDIVLNFLKANGNRMT